MIEFEKINLKNAKEGLCLQDIGIENELHKLDWIICTLAETEGEIPSDGLYYLLYDIHHNLKKTIELVDEDIIHKLHERSGGAQ